MRQKACWRKEKPMRSRPLEDLTAQQAGGPTGYMARWTGVGLEWEIPMSVTLPIQVQPDSAHQPFPFLDTILANLGIQESEVKERVVCVDIKKTQVKNKAGRLREKEITILEVRVKTQKPGDKQFQEVLYSTEAHTDGSFFRTAMKILPWKKICTGENGYASADDGVGHGKSAEFTEGPRDNGRSEEQQSQNHVNQCILM